MSMKSPDDDPTMAAHNTRLVEQARLARHTRIVQSATTKRDLAGPDPDREPADEYKRKGG
jgi:hypothetical protein